MIKKAMALISVTALFLTAQGQADELQGTWKYNYYKYQDSVQPLPNPDLDLRFSFNADGTVFLKWFYKGQDGFCERKANYQIQSGGVLYQKVTWLNPNNHTSCVKDVDMQMGKETFNYFDVVKGQLSLQMELGGDPFYLIFDSENENERTKK
jgi:hypothetical protein